MKANSDKSKQSNKATRRVLAGVLCGASVLSLVLSLVMPPISQAIANDVQAVSTEEIVTGDSSTESTDVKNTNNGDTDNQNSDETEGDGTGDDTLRAAPLPDDTGAESVAQPADDSANGEGAIALAAENKSTYTISSGAELSEKLLAKELRDATGSATFELVADIKYNGEIKFEQTDNKPINITLNLNGHKIECLNTDKPLFDVAGGATLTIKDEIKDSAPVTETVSDGQLLTDQGQSLNADNYDKYAANYGKNANLTYDKDNDNIPSNLTYYVTESSPNETGTTETLVKHDVEIKGAIVACGGKTNLRLINLYNRNGKGGTFNLVSGVITQKQDGSVSSLVYAEGGSTVNMRGGYVCGALGSGIMVSNESGDASTLDLTGGVIAGNCASSGGGVYAKGSAVKVTGGVISGNSTLASGAGLGGGIMASGGKVTVSGGHITNNRMARFCGADGSGCHGGAGLAANNGAHVTISDGQITGNYSEEAGGGVYVTNLNQGDTAWLDITGGYIASNVSYRSEGAGIRVGQKVDATIGDTPDNNGTPGSKVYITNNCCMSRFDWGGGGIFVQGDSKIPENAGRLFVYNSYISSNTAGGYGGGVAVCPTGKTLVTNTKGTAIFGNSSARDETGWQNDYNTEYNSGNNNTPHLSGGGIGDTDKTEDRDAYASSTFRESGHADFFLAARKHTTPVAVVSGKMLGGIDAKYSGSIELTDRITIPANGVAQVKNSIGLTSDVKATDQAVTDLVQGKVQGTKVTTFITGNYSWDHGGGIMSNGNLYLGQPADAYVYPSLKLKATKELTGRNLKAREFTFTVYRKDSDAAKAPSWDDNGNFSTGDCESVESVPNSADGNIAFDLSEKLSKQLSDQFKASGAGETTDYDITYYLVEDAGNKLGVKYDHAVYEIKVKVKCTPTELMSVPIQGKPNETKKLMVYNFTIDRVDVTKNPGGSASSQDHVPLDDGYYSIVNSSSSTSTNKATFTNTYTSPGSWTPKATKVVEGGEMKKFTLQLATDSNFGDGDIIGTAETAGSRKTQTLSFRDVSDKKSELKLNYSLSDIMKDPDTAGDSTGRGASKTFTYYVREQLPTTSFTNYRYDQSVYEIKVVATDKANEKIDCKVTYKQIQDRDGNPVANGAEHTFSETDNPTFTNTYSTSLPLSGMSGVTLTYLAGAAVLCAAAAWMHIRRKANAKGGKRRE